MTNIPTTVRTSAGPTVNDIGVGAAESSAVARIMEYWRKQTDASVMQAIEEFPSLLENKSLLLDLVLKDFQHRRQNSQIPIDEYCENFRQFGSSIEQSIFRALEVQDYFDAHPELLELVARFDWPSSGDYLQGFQVVEELGRGALARVYLCRETGVGGREVVVKIARSGAYEAEMLGRLDHPNIVPVYSVTNDSDRCASYICMPYRGRSTLLDLVESLRKGGVPQSDRAIWDAASFWVGPSEKANQTSRLRGNRTKRSGFVDGVLRIAIQLASALKYAHQMGVYHGDLKPSNVLLTQTAVPLLIDFNLATDLTSGGVPRGGTLAYMPPEQLLEISGAVGEDVPKYDARSEIYSFGALIFQLLTGEVPYHVVADHNEPAALARRLAKLQHSQRLSIRTKNSLVNTSLEKLILSCLAIEPDDRPQSMSELVCQLHRQCNTAAIVKRAVAKRPVLSWSLIGLTLAAVIFGALYLSLRPPYHVRQYARGMVLQERGNYDEAIVHFDRAVASDPMDQAAAFERARTRLLQSDFAGAVADFARLWETSADPRCAAYAGYSFNLQGNASAAIPWYELALSHQMNTVGLQNNLGISYARGRSTAGQLERLDRAQEHLDRALILNNSSLAIRGNLVQLALIRSDIDPTFDPKSAVTHLEYLKQHGPQSPTVAKYAVQLYSQLSLNNGAYVEPALLALDRAIRLGAGPSAMTLEQNPNFDVVRGDKRFDVLCKAAKASHAKPQVETLAMFIDPLSGNEQRKAAN